MGSCCRREKRPTQALVARWSVVLWMTTKRVDAIWNALHDGRAAVGDAEPCCATCDTSVLGAVCPKSMPERHVEKVVTWSQAFGEVEANGTVTIPCGWRVDLDQSPPPLKGLYVRGHLNVLDGVDMMVRSDFVYVCGVMNAGSATARHESAFEVVLTGRTPLMAEGIDYGIKAFAVFGGLVYLRGSTTTAWTRLGKSVYPGDVGRPPIDADWPVGSRIAVASTDWDAEQTEEMELTAHGFKEPFRFAHSGTDPARAEVGLLTRNLKVRSECETVASKPLCGHFIISHTPHGVVESVEFTRLGHHTTLGKYPLHLHMCGRAPTLVLRRNSIHHNVHRALVVHSTAEATIEQNVAFLTQGHMFVFENGLEIRNRVLENLGMVTRGPRPRWSCDGFSCAGADGCGFGSDPSTLEACGSRDDGHAEIFWIANPMNDFVGNVAVGGWRAAFAIYPVHAGPLVNNTLMQRKIGLPEHLVDILDQAKPFGRTSWSNTLKFYGPNSTQASVWRTIDRAVSYQGTAAKHIEFAPFGIFERNVAHSARLGFSLYPQLTPRLGASSSSSNKADSAFLSFRADHRSLARTGGGGEKTTSSVYAAGEQAAVLRNLTAYKIYGTAFRIKSRCSRWECITISGAHIFAAAMGVRARDVYSRASVVDTRVIPLFNSSTDPAFINGGCLSRGLRLARDETCRGFSLGGYHRQTASYYDQALYGDTHPGFLRCSPCNVSWPPRETNKLFHKLRSCKLPFWAVNFDTGTIRALKAEICTLNNADKSLPRVERATSCYTDHFGNNLSSTIKVDRATLDHVAHAGFQGSFFHGRNTIDHSGQPKDISPAQPCGLLSDLVLGSFHVENEHNFPDFLF